MPYLICKECGNVLTDLERHYYENKCESCERLWLEAVERWRRGEEENEEFDKVYMDEETPIKH